MGGGIRCCCGTGIRPSFEWNSLPGSEFICISVALWLAEERWNENHSKLLTPAQELRRNAQLCSGVVEQSLLSSCVYSTNPAGTVGEGGHTRREERGKMSKREEGNGEDIVRAGLRLKINALSFFFLSGAAQLNSASAIQRSASSFPSEVILNRSPPSLKVYPGTEICATEWDFGFWKVCRCYQRGQSGSRTVPGALLLQIKACFAID